MRVGGWGEEGRVVANLAERDIKVERKEERKTKGRKKGNCCRCRIEEN